MSFYFPDSSGGKKLVGAEATASESVKGGVIVTGNDGLVMDGKTLKVVGYTAVDSFTGNAFALSNSFSSPSDSIDMHGIIGDSINMSGWGKCSTGGTIDMSGGTRGGILHMGGAPSTGGSITGNIYLLARLHSITI